MSKRYPADDHPGYDPDPLLDQLQVLKEQPRRDPKAAAQARSAYLSQVSDLIQEHARDQSKVAQKVGLPESIARTLQAAFSPRRPVYALAWLALLVVFLFAAGGISVAAAQNSLPGETLYPVKVFSEGVQHWLRPAPQQQVRLALEFANRRVEEMISLDAEGEPIPPDVPASLEVEVKTALVEAGRLPETQMQTALQQISETFEHQQRAIERILSGFGTNPASEVQAAYRTLQSSGQIARTGAADPAWFRQQADSGFTEPLVSPQPEAMPGQAITQTPTPVPYLETPQQAGQVTPTSSGRQGTPAEAQGTAVPGGAGGNQDTQTPAGEQHQTSPVPSGPARGAASGTPDDSGHEGQGAKTQINAQPTKPMK